MSQVDEASVTTRAQLSPDAQTAVPKLGAMVTRPSKARVVRAAAVQISPDFVNHDGTINKVLDAIDGAAGQGAELIVFPETLVPYYPYFAHLQAPALQRADHLRFMERALVVPGPETEAVAARALARGAVIVLGRQRAGAWKRLQHSAGVRRRWFADPQAPQAHAHPP